MRITLCSLFLLFFINQRTLGLPAGFRDEGVAFKSGSTGFAFVPTEDGGSILLICQRKGEVVALLDPDKPGGKLVDVLDMEEKVCSQGERGVSQILPHPDFLKNRYLYLTYTYDINGGCEFSDVDGPVNVVSRFRLTDDLKMVDEKILVQTTPLPSKVHNGGDMKFGNDGYLYVTLGNGGKANEYGNSQKMNTLLGSVIRITDDGGIPPDNPFTEDKDRACAKSGSTSSSRRCSELWAIGFRNPFRFAMNPNQKKYTQFYVSDVGGATWEEISEVTSKSPAKNYGYREMEGPCDRGSKTNCKPNEKYEDPLYWYEHNSGGDGCVSGGAFVPKGIWPKEYDNKYLFADFIFQKIFTLSESGDGCRDCSPPRPDFERDTFKSTKDTGQPVQLTFGPYKNTQALYYSLWAVDEGGYSIRRIVYEGGENRKNRSPDAEIKIEDKIFNINEDIIFDGSSSSDPDGNELSFEWDFGDGGASTKMIKTRSYRKVGKFRVTLTVSDEFGFEDKTSTTIIVGAPPTPVIDYPEEGETFAVNDIFMLVGHAMDDDGNSLSDSDLTWEVRQVHSTHYHPFLGETVGNDIVIPPAPSPEDFDASTNSFLKILLTATDKNGLTQTVTRDIMPKTKKLYFNTDPPGLELKLDGFKIKTPDDAPLEIISWVNHNLVIDVEDQGDMIFDRWNDGIESRYIANEVKEDFGKEVRTAIFVKSNPSTAMPSSPTTVSDDVEQEEAGPEENGEETFSASMEHDWNATEAEFGMTDDEDWNMTEAEFEMIDTEDWNITNIEYGTIDPTYWNVTESEFEMIDSDDWNATEAELGMTDTEDWNLTEAEFEMIDIEDWNITNVEYGTTDPDEWNATDLEFGMIDSDDWNTTMADFDAESDDVIVDEYECSSTYDTICKNNNLFGFCEAIEVAGLASVFDEGQWTIFAPDDGAIVKATAFLDLLRGDVIDEDLLREYLLYHISPDSLLTKGDLPCDAGANLVPMANGKDSRTLCVDSVPTYQKGKGNPDDYMPQIVEFDIPSCNGVIHIIDKVLLLE